MIVCIFYISAIVLFENICIEEMDARGKIYSHICAIYERYSTVTSATSEADMQPKSVFLLLLATWFDYFIIVASCPKIL